MYPISAATPPEVYNAHSEYLTYCRSVFHPAKVPDIFFCRAIPGWHKSTIWPLTNYPEPLQAEIKNLEKKQTEICVRVRLRWFRVYTVKPILSSKGKRVTFLHSQLHKCLSMTHLTLLGCTLIWHPLKHLLKFLRPEHINHSSLCFCQREMWICDRKWGLFEMGIWMWKWPPVENETKMM